MQTVAHLPRLIELDVQTSRYIPEVRIPLGLFSNLSKLSAGYYHASFFISEMSTVIANSSQLKSLEVACYGHDVPLLTLSDLFAKLSTKNPLCLEHLSIVYMDATVNQSILPHLMQLASFQFYDNDLSVARSVWTSFLVNNVKLSHVEIHGSMTEEMISYLSSFSGLKKLAVGGLYVPSDMAMENLKKMLFTAVLPKHVNSLRTLELRGSLLVKLPDYVLFFC
jgi:hypothetical protein